MPTIGKIRIFRYVNYEEQNYGVHTLGLEVSRVAVIYFSYETPIAAYFYDDDTLYVDTYPYSRTTAYHRDMAVKHAEEHYFPDKIIDSPDIDIEELVRKKFGSFLVKLVSEAL